MKNKKTNKLRTRCDKESVTDAGGADGFEAGWSFSHAMSYMDFRIPIGQMVTISKHPDIEIPEHCLGDWILIGYNADGSMKLCRHIDPQTLKPLTPLKM